MISPSLDPRRSGGFGSLVATTFAGSALFLALLPALLPGAGSAEGQALTPDLLKPLEFRSIGPAVTGGRVHDVEALPGDPATLYVASASGGLWKSTNGGTTWTPIFDHQAVSTFGDVAIAPGDPDIVYAGTGEQNNRQSTSWGNGVYRSDDGGATWTHLGLTETRHIGKVEVHPSDPDVAWVAALGNLWAGSEERGVYRTTDGGRTWEKVLYVDEYTGAVDLVLDPSDPAILYAATYQRLRRTWGFNGGGPGSGIYKTTDGGESWRELTDGIPEGDKGRIGLAISASNPGVLNATIQHREEGGTYRSEDGGERWERMSDMNPRPMYYSEIFIDPLEEDRVYVLGTSSYRSEDGGASWTGVAERPTYDVGVHADHHALWIDPDDTEHLYLGGDAGLHESWDRGETFRRINNFVIGQFYAIGVDMRDPYWIYGGMQDNHSWMGPSATRHWIGIINDDWRQIGFGDGMYHQIDPTNPRLVYSNAQNGSYTRVDSETGDILDIAPRAPEGEPDYRFDWVSPSLISRHDPNVVYVGGNRLFLSRDRGHSWERTEDLTRQIDRDRLELMGVRGVDIALSPNDGTSSFGEIVTIAESPLDPDILWVGTDDGNIQVSRDGGATWSEVARNVRGVRDGTYVSRVIASVRGPEVAYATFDAHRDGDFAPYVFRTENFGRMWTPLHADLPSGSVNVIVEHPDNPDLLFLGTEHHLFASADAGVSWTRFPGPPTTHYDDLVIHPRENDLVAGTHGRGIWVLDDVTPLVEWTADAADAPAHLFSIRRATFFHYWKDTSYRAEAAYAGENPPFGAILTYHLGEAVPAARIVVRSDGGDVVRTLEVPGEAGMHRVTWDLRHQPPPSIGNFGRGGEEPELPRPIGPRGPFVSPGLFRVTLEAGEARARQMVLVRGDPLTPVDLMDHREREAFLLEVQELQRQIPGLAERAGDLRETLVRQRDAAPEGSREREALAARADSAQALERSIRSAARRLFGLAGDFNGSGVRQGSLYPPTEIHRRMRAELAGVLEEAARALDEQESS